MKAVKHIDWHAGPQLAEWQIPADHPSLAGHFPGHPVLPGALLLAWVIQEVSRATQLEVQEVREARFHGVARPGARLQLRVDVAHTPAADSLSRLRERGEGVKSENAAQPTPDLTRFVVIDAASNIAVSGVLHLRDAHLAP